MEQYSQQRDTAPLEEYALGLVAYMIEAREKEGEAPFMAFLDEMIQLCAEDLKEVMRRAVRNKTVVCHKDLNGKIMFEFTPPK